jgi:MFS family permease
MLLFSRFIEGAGMGLISVAVPAGLAMWFPDDRRGLAMGVWNNWMPIGNMIAFSVVPQIVARTNYKGAWWFTIAYSAVCLVLCLLFMRTPKPGEVDYGEAAPVGETVNDTVSKKQVTLKDALSNKNIWYIAIVSLCFGFVINLLSTYYTTFTTENNIMTATQTGTALSIQNLMGMVCALLAGVILGRMKNRKMLLFWSMIGFSVLYLCLFKISSIPLIYLWLVVYSPFTAFAPTTLFTIAPDVMRSPEEASYGMSMVTLGQNFGMFIGAPIFGSLVTKIGWNGAGYCMIPILLIGAFFTWIVKSNKEA